ncbi:MAG: CRTAC1 family protein, partial [Candidatus Latescibacteria bacterium]|nr:CRTAC1 family protein [Candidatus Latescibacterota bacterium]
MTYRIVNLILILLAAGCGSRQESTPKVGVSDETFPVVFTDVTRAAGITFVNDQGDRVETILQVMGSGAAWGDYDDDGDLDLYLVNGSGSSDPAALSRTKGDDGSSRRIEGKRSDGSTRWVDGREAGGSTRWRGRRIPPPEGWSEWTGQSDGLAVGWNGGGNVLYRNNGDGTFTDVTGQTGVGYKGHGMGAVFADIDNDGDLDLYLTNNGPNVLYRNNRVGGQSGSRVGRSGSGGDRSGGSMEEWTTGERMTEGVTFTDISHEAGVDDPRWSTGAAFADIDHDGDLDLYVANYLEFRRDLIPQEARMTYDRDEPLSFLPHPYAPQGNTLYLNNGDGTFTDITDRAGVADPEGKSLGVAFGDYDNDGDQDLYVANDVSNDVLFRNSGDRTFTNINVDAGVDDPRGGMGVCWGDYDNDGDLDIFVTNWQDEMNVLYRNNLPKTPVGPVYVGNFDDVTVQAGLGEASLGHVGWGSEFFDYDNDGDLDLFITNGYTSPGKDTRTCIGERNLLFRNNSEMGRQDQTGGQPGRSVVGQAFTDVSALAGDVFKRELVGRGAAFGDYDNDGDVDIVVVNNNGPATLLRNDGGNRPHWLNVRLVGTKSNRYGIGARITVVTGEKRQIREVAAGSSYISCNSVEAEFGLGASTTVDSLIVRWPGRRVQ